MNEITSPNNTSDGKIYSCTREALTSGAHEFVTLYRRSLDYSISGSRRRRRREQVIKKARQAFFILGAVGLSLSNAPPGVMARQFAYSDELRFRVTDVKYEATLKENSPNYETMIRQCRSRIDGSIDTVTDKIRNQYLQIEFQHIATDLFYVDDHNVSSVTMFQTKDRHGLIVTNEVRANLALPSCAVSNISFGLE